MFRVSWMIPQRRCHAFSHDRAKRSEAPPSDAGLDLPPDALDLLEERVFLVAPSPSELCQRERGSVGDAYDGAFARRSAVTIRDGNRFRQWIRRCMQWRPSEASRRSRYRRASGGIRASTARQAPSRRGDFWRHGSSVVDLRALSAYPSRRRDGQRRARRPPASHRVHREPSSQIGARISSCGPTRASPAPSQGAPPRGRRAIAPSLPRTGRARAATHRRGRVRARRGGTSGWALQIRMLRSLSST